jgi:hypothetical protein
MKIDLLYFLIIGLYHLKNKNAIVDESFIVEMDGTEYERQNRKIK